MVLKKIKSTVRKTEIILGIDRVAARFLPYMWRRFFIPGPSYYSSLTRKFHSDGVVWCIDPSQYTQHKILMGGCAAPLGCATRRLRNTLQKFDVLDIGANSGGFSLPLAACLQDKDLRSVHLFEPNPSTYSRLEKQIRLNPSLSAIVVPHCRGLGSELGELELHVPKRSDGLASFERSYSDEKTDVITVPVSTVDAFVAEQKLRVGFMKIDVEGFEANVLRGAREVLEHQRPAVFCEMGAGDVEAREILKSFDYRIVERFERDILWER